MSAYTAYAGEGSLILITIRLEFLGDFIYIETYFLTGSRLLHKHWSI